MRAFAWAWVPFGLSAACLVAAIALFAGQLDNRISWDLWWVPDMLALAAPIGLLACYALVGAPLRGLAAAGVAWGLLLGLGALGVTAGMASDRGGEVIALMMAIGAGLALLWLGAVGYDMRGRLP